MNEVKRTEILQLAKDGLFYEEISAILPLTQDEWEEVREDAERLAKAWWLNQGRHLVLEGRGNAPVWIKIMAFQFGWIERKFEDKPEDDERRVIVIDFSADETDKNTDST